MREKLRYDLECASTVGCAKTGGTIVTRTGGAEVGTAATAVVATGHVE